MIIYFQRLAITIDLYGRWLEHGINDGTKCVIVLFLSVYLNVTDLTTYNVGYDSFCIRWAPHRAATSYRLEVKPFDRKSNERLCLFSFAFFFGVLVASRRGRCDNLFFVATHSRSLSLECKECKSFCVHTFGS